MMTHVPSSVWKLRRRPYPFALSHPAPVCSHLEARRGAAVHRAVVGGMATKLPVLSLLDISVLVLHTARNRRTSHLFRRNHAACAGRSTRQCRRAYEIAF